MSATRYNQPTWADGFGVWHTSIEWLDESGRTLSDRERAILARRAIRAELVARGNGRESYAGMSVGMAWYDSRRVVYREEWATA